MIRSNLIDSWRRGSRTAPLWLAALVILSTGCVATKKDVRLLQTDIAAMRARQDSLHRELQRQDRVLLDTLRNNADFARSMSGRLNNDLRELKQMVQTIEALLGQTQQRIAEARSEVQRLQEAQTAAQQATQPVTSAPTGQSADDLYRVGMTKMEEKSFATARLAFEEILRAYGQHERAADAQLQLAETYALDGDPERAYQEFDRVVEMHPNKPQAPRALFRAGQIAEAERDRTKARSYYNKVVQRYRTSDEASLAQSRLRALR